MYICLVCIRLLSDIELVLLLFLEEITLTAIFELRLYFVWASLLLNKLFIHTTFRHSRVSDMQHSVWFDWDT